MAVERTLERLIFGSRWILAPLYVGLVIAALMLLVKFVQELIHLVPHTLEFSEAEIVLAVLTLVDLTLLGNLLLIVIFSGDENFVSKIDVGDHKDRPEWMGKVDYSGLKIKLIASIVAISSIQILKAFMNVDKVSDRDLDWMVGIHVMFIVSGVLLALMDRLSGKSQHSGE